MNQAGLWSGARALREPEIKPIILQWEASMNLNCPMYKHSHGEANHDGSALGDNHYLFYFKRVWEQKRQAAEVKRGKGKLWTSLTLRSTGQIDKKE